MLTTIDLLVKGPYLVWLKDRTPPSMYSLVSGRAEASFLFGQRMMAKPTILLRVGQASLLPGLSELGLMVAWTLLLVGLGEQMEGLCDKHVLDGYRLTM
jgi:hypothetical protein